MAEEHTSQNKSDDLVTEEKKHFDAEFDKITDDLKEVEKNLVEGVEEWQRQTNNSTLGILCQMQKIYGTSHKQLTEVTKDTVEEYRRTFEVFVKYPRQMLTHSVHTAISKRSSEVKDLQSCLDGLMDGKTKRVLPRAKKKIECIREECDAFEKEMVELEEQHKTFFQPQDAANCSTEGEEENPSKLPIAVRELIQVKRDLKTLTHYFKCLGSLAKRLEDQEDRMQDLSKDCEEWIEIVKDQKEALIASQQRISTVASEERSRSMHAVARSPGLAEDIDGVAFAVDCVTSSINLNISDEHLLNACSEEQSHGRSEMVLAKSVPVPEHDQPSEKPKKEVPDLKLPERDSGTGSAKETLELFNSPFFEKVQAIGIFRVLYQNEVIPESVKTKIEKSDSNEEANHLLYNHLKPQATFCDLTTMATTMSNAEGFAQMRNFGNDFETVLKSQDRRCTCEKHKR
jgi:hypothetical protein